MKLGRVALAAALCLVGCRSIIGITVLEVDDDHDSGVQPSVDATAGVDAQPDASGAPDTATLTDASDSAPPPQPDTSPPPEQDAMAQIRACVERDAGCVPCCQSLPSFVKFQQYAVDSGCLCGACATSEYCASTLCATPAIASSGGPCDCCVDTLLLRPDTCGAAATACQNDPSCAAAAQCFGACNPSSYTCPNAPP